MMPYSEDHIALAAEYALGTLDADERAQVETMMSVDKDFAAIVDAWEDKLSVLDQMVRPGPALAQCCELQHGDRGSTGRDDRGRGLSAGFTARWRSSETARAGG